MEDYDELFDNELHLAVRVGDIDACAESLKEGYDANTIGLFEWSAVHEAAHNGELKILQLLLKHGGDPNHRDYLNGSTALHYAASEGHPQCLDVLLLKGGDPNIQNDNGLTFAQMARHRKCKDVLAKYGIDVTTSVHFEDKLPTKSELHHTNQSGESENSVTRKDLKLPSSISPKRTTKSCLSDESYESGIGSKTSLSDTASNSSARSPVIRSYGRSTGPEQTSSPCKSYSSFGSLTSIGSSIVSGSDDCAGYIMMAFQYNSKTAQLKIRINEIVLLSLLLHQKNRKDSSLQLHVSSKIYNPNEVKINENKTLLHAKSDTFRLHPGGDQENLISDMDGSMQTSWRERDAQVKFSKSLMVEFTNITKDIVSNSTIQISICTRSKKNLLHKNANQSIPFATLDLPLKQASRNLMKETYELQPCHVHGITRERETLEQVLSELIVDSGKVKAPSVYSEPHMKGCTNESFAMEEIERSVSDSELKRVTVDNSTTTSPSNSCYDIGEHTESSLILDTVESHSTPASPQVKVKMPVTASRPESLELNQWHRKDTRMEIPNESDGITGRPGKNNSEFLKKAKIKMHQVASGSTKNLHRLVVSRNQTEVDEEHTVGTPSEEIQLKTLSSSFISESEKVPRIRTTDLCSENKIRIKHTNPRKNINSHTRTSSNDSFIKVDENLLSPSRRRKQIKHSPRTNTHTETSSIGYDSQLDKDNSNLTKHYRNTHTVLLYSEEANEDGTMEANNPWYVNN